jgi:hypothetical protein
MGYHTGFQGEFRLEPALNAAQRDYVLAFVDVRHGQRKTNLIQNLPDPFREAAKLELGRQGLNCTATLANSLEVYSDYNRPAEGAPGLYCPWTINADGSTLISSYPDKAYEPQEWLGFLLQHFLIPWHVVASGVVLWHGERVGDAGAYSIVANHLEVVSFRGLLEQHLRTSHHL